MISIGIKAEKRRLIESIGITPEAFEFIENLFDHLHENKFSEDSKKAIKNTLEQKYREFEIIGNSDADRFMRQNITQFLSNITFNENYKNCVQEIQNNIKQVSLANLLTEIRNFKKNRRNK